MQWFERISEFARAALHPAFQTHLLPASKDGAHFLIQSGSEGWKAEIRGTIRWRGLELSYEPLGFGSFLVGEGRKAVESGSLLKMLEAPFLQEYGATSHIVSDGKRTIARELTHSGIGQTFRLETGFTPFAARNESGDVDGAAVVIRLGGFLQAVVCASPTLEARFDLEVAELFIEEGGQRSFTGHRYERSALARAICISLKGDSCEVCGMRYGERYGRLGEGYIHVHHLEPLAHSGGSHEVNPKVDLVPVCASCHAMLHRRTPPLSPEELRAQMST